MGFIKNEQRDITKLWDTFTHEITRFEKINKPVDFYGIVSYPENWTVNGYLYFTGMKLDSYDLTNSILVTKTIPALTYAKFSHKGSSNERKFISDYIFHTWLPRSGRNVTILFEMEYYGNSIEVFDKKEIETYIYIPLT
jgi:AraC family transcriptional regulator